MPLFAWLLIAAFAFLVGVVAGLTLAAGRRFAPDEIVTIDGKPARVEAVEWSGTKLMALAYEPLGDYLARSVVVSRRGNPVTLFEALADAGWLPPGEPRKPGAPLQFDQQGRMIGAD